MPGSRSLLLTRQQLDFEIKREMIRAERSRQSLAFIVIELRESCRSRRDFSHLSKLLQRRLRRSDTAGYLERGCAAVLLPRTTREGARKVANDICEFYSRDNERPTCRVYELSDFIRSLPHDGRVSGPEGVSEFSANTDFMNTSPAFRESPAIEVLEVSVEENDA